ncbi:hypothetical protein ACFO5K_12530 [Nocardia halotolerans]|uniref:Uncharacterized protein n=1 Tax=Nocardia halotolerans TaxID=1755878 RepID=A0ABV8VJB3_9NOCA
MDRDLAEQLLAIEDRDETFDGAATPEGYTLDTYLLLTIVDAVQGVQAAVIAAAGADPPAFDPMPRPETALDLVREEHRRRSMERLIAEFTHPG